MALDGEQELARIFDGVKRNEGFGNARFARTLFEQALSAQALRLAEHDGAELAEAATSELMALHASDLGAAARALGEDGEATKVRRWGRAR